MPTNSHQQIIAIIWDFDKTLIPGYMQEPIFEKFNINESQFWKESNQLPGLYAKNGIKINPDTAYLNHILSYVRQGKLKGLSNDLFLELGSKLKFFPGLPDFFKITKDLIANNENFSKFDIKLEHYVVSTGLTQMIKGSPIMPFIDGVWGCEFIENIFISGENGLEQNENSNPEITDIAYTIDNTTKTKALFEINKGVNKIEELNVNQRMEPGDRRVPFENMIYIADGPSDVPAFSVVKERGGKTFAVYQKENIKSFKQANQLLEDKRVNLIGEADYREGTTTYLWLTEEIKEMANKIAKTKKSKLLEGSEGIPKHLT